MTMTPKREPEADAGTTTPAGDAPRKPYLRPTVRVLGAVHVMTRGNGVTLNGDGGQMMRMRRMR